MTTLRLDHDGDEYRMKLPTEFRADDRVVGTGRIWPRTDTEQFVIERNDGSAIGVIAVVDGAFRTFAIIGTDQRFGSGRRVNLGQI